MLFETFLSHTLREIQRVISKIGPMFTHGLEKPIWLVIELSFENQGHVKITASHVLCKCGTVIYRKRCQIASLLIQTTSRK